MLALMLALTHSLTLARTLARTRNPEPRTPNPEPNPNPSPNPKQVFVVYGCVFDELYEAQKINATATTDELLMYSWAWYLPISPYIS